ncbi:MAG: flagellar basal body rod protein FlgB [Robiginitomaculum sp.]|nr:flagellar basal body rod protein FlgB [Robiginitomaculum sp.]MDQ7078162.1 flagellar basal body rod protein FlgB [Robiginitomaculum sp.]
MSLNRIAVFDVLRSTMAMLGERQKVLARNIANANTPGYVAKDIDDKSFNKLLSNTMHGQRSSGPHVTMQVTEPGHIRRQGSRGASKTFKVVDRPDSETTLNGNSVVLEEQVMRVAETRMRYEAAAGLYEKSMGLLRLAISRPGR